MYVQNTGSATTTISAVYYDGTLLTQGTITTANTDQALVANQWFAFASTVTITTAATLHDFQASTTTQQTTLATSGTNTGRLIITFGAAVTPGTAHTVKVISSTGATYVFAVTSGRQG